MWVDLKQDLAVTTDGLTLTVFGGLLPLRLPLWHIAWISLGMSEIEGPNPGALGRLELPGWLGRVSRGDSRSGAGQGSDRRGRSVTEVRPRPVAPAWGQPPESCPTASAGSWCHALSGDL